MRTTVGLVLVTALVAWGTVARADDDTAAKKKKAKPAVSKEIRELEAEIEALTVRIERLKAEKKFADAERETEKLTAAKRWLDAARTERARKSSAWPRATGEVGKFEWKLLEEKTVSLSRALRDKEAGYARATKALDAARARLASLEETFASVHPRVMKAKDDLRSAEQLAASLGQQVDEARSALDHARKASKVSNPYVISLGTEDRIKPGFLFERDGKAGSKTDWIDFSVENPNAYVGGTRMRAFDLGAGERRELEQAIAVLQRNGMQRQAEEVRKQMAAMDQRSRERARGDHAMLAEVRALRADVRALRQDVAQLKALVKQMAR